MKQYLSIEAVKEFILSKSESLEMMIKAHYGLSSSPTPQTFEHFYMNTIVPKTKESEALGRRDLSTVLEDLAKNARSCEMRNACALLYMCVKFNSEPKRNEKNFNPRKMKERRAFKPRVKKEEDESSSQEEKRHFEPRKTGEKRIFKPRVKKEEVDESSSQEEK